MASSWHDPCVFPSPPHISMAAWEAVEGAEAAEIGLSFQESLHIWVAACLPEPGTRQIAFEDPDQHVHAENLLFFIGWSRKDSRLQSNSAHKMVIAAGGRDHEWGVPPNLGQVALWEPNLHIRLWTDIATLQKVRPAGQNKTVHSLID